MVANKTMFNIPKIGSLYYDTIFYVRVSQYYIPA